jgi:hypothetical protein
MHNPTEVPSFARLNAKPARGNACTPGLTVADTVVA